MKRAWMSVVVLVVAVFVSVVTVRTQGQAGAANANNKTTLYLTATAHLDSQWNWTVQDSIRDHIPKTFNTNFEYFEKYPDYKFSWEGAIHYMWFKEYHPDQWATLQKYVAADRWRLAGSWIDAVDPNMPSPESLFRQALYAQRFFRQEFKKEPHDVYLPDCFGFGFSLPSIAVASGLNAFSTQKLTWGRAIPFPIGRWKGVDGSELIVGLNPGSYGTNIIEPITLTSTNRAPNANGNGNATPWLNDPTPIGGGRQLEFRYFGTGDTGGGPSEASVQNVQKSISDPNQKVDIRLTSPDQMAKDLTPEQKAMLPEYNSELILKTHGTGCYTSQAAMKRFNRVNELLADEAERAGVAAEFLTGQPYPTERLRDAWIRFIWHQFHDDLTGTCIPQAYQFSWNDEIASMNQFAGVLTSSTKAVSSMLDTSASAGASVPLVVYNPLSLDRHEPVEATVTMAATTGGVQVIDPATGEAVPSQVLNRDAAGTHIAFLANAPSVGYKVYEVKPAVIEAEASSLRVSPSSLENNRISVKIDQNGDISSIYDKDAKHELLKAPIMLELRDNPSPAWPAWEVLYETVQSPAREYLSRPTVRVIETGPVRVGVEVTRKASGSTFVQRIRLSEGGDRVDVENLVDWRSPNSELKASFPLTASNPKAVYDLGVGTIERTNNEPEKYEVPAQKWADIVDASGTFGVGIINDSKYGWDKPNDSTLRLTLLHTPKPAGGYTYQSSNDLGQHRFVYAIAAHAGDWRQGHMPTRAWQLNQPLVAFQTTTHAGVMGRAFSMGAVSSAPVTGELPVRDTAGQVSIVAMKKAEDSDEYIIRLQERYGLPAVATLRFAGQIVSAREVNAAEEEIGPIALAGGGGNRGRGGAGAAPTVQTYASVPITMKPYQPKTIAIRLQSPWDAMTAFKAAQAAAAAAAAANPGGRGGGGRGNATPPPDVPAPTPVASAMVELPFNLDGVSADAARADGNFDGKGHTIAAELLPSSVTVDGVPFRFGSGAPGAKNVVVPSGQTVALPAGAFNHVYVIAAAVGGDINASFGIGGAMKPVTIREWQGPVGQWWSRLKGVGPALQEPFVPARGATPSQQEIQDGLIVSWNSKTGEVSGIDQIRSGFVKRDEIAWIGSHRHDPKDNEPYVSSYLFLYTFDLPAGTKQITLPSNDKLRIMAISVAGATADVTPAGLLYIPDITAQAPRIPPAPPAIK